MRLTIWETIKTLTIKRKKKTHTISVIMVNGFPDPSIKGEWVPSLSEIRVDLNQSFWDQTFVGFHELIHAISDIYELGLTEKQVVGIEEGMASVFKNNPDFTLDPPK